VSQTGEKKIQGNGERIVGTVKREGGKRKPHRGYAQKFPRTKGIGSGPSSQGLKEKKKKQPISRKKNEPSQGKGAVGGPDWGLRKIKGNYGRALRRTMEQLYQKP